MSWQAVSFLYQLPHDTQHNNEKCDSIMALRTAIKRNTQFNFVQYPDAECFGAFADPEAVFLVVCDPSMNELWAT